MCCESVTTFNYSLQCVWCVAFNAHTKKPKVEKFALNTDDVLRDILDSGDSNSDDAYGGGMTGGFGNRLCVSLC